MSEYDELVEKGRRLVGKIKQTSPDYAERVGLLINAIEELQEYRQITETFIGTHKEVENEGFLTLMLDLRDFCTKLDELDTRNRGEK